RRPPYQASKASKYRRAKFASRRARYAASGYAPGFDSSWRTAWVTRKYMSANGASWSQAAASLSKRRVISATTPPTHPGLPGAHSAGSGHGPEAADRGGTLEPQADSESRTTTATVARLTTAAGRSDGGRDRCRQWWRRTVRRARGCWWPTARRS